MDIKETLRLHKLWLGCLSCLSHALNKSPKCSEPSCSAYLGVRADLSGKDLSDIDLSGVDLSSADLSNANLAGANLSGANLMGANLQNAYLSDADLSDANLFMADLQYAKLYNADLERADLTSTNLYCANLTGANLRFANLNDARNLMAICASQSYRPVVLYTGGEFISIGSDCFTIDYWLENYDKIGKKYRYASEQIEEYHYIIRMISDMRIARTIEASLTRP